MPIPVSFTCRNKLRKNGTFHTLYIALLLLSFHYAAVVYINSSYLAQFVTSKTIGILYIVGAFFTLLAFLHASPLLRHFGNVRLTLTLTLLEFWTLISMAFATSAKVAIPLFILHQAIVPLILFTLDIFMEELIGKKEGTTGGHRGLFLSISSLTAACAAFGVGKLLGNDIPDFFLAYIGSALFLIPFLVIIIIHFRCFIDPEYPHLKVFQGITTFWKYKDIRNVFFAHFLLQLFFSWMVIYTPVYLATVIGFDWETIGSILFVGLMAYVLLEYLIGYLADTFWGEKEMMAFGFTVIGVAVSWFIFLDGSSVLAWMLAMFMTRVGASLVETTTESYFFKKIEGKDTNIIGLFRITQPLGYMVGSALGVVTLILLPFQLLFMVLGLMMIPGLFFRNGTPRYEVNIKI